MTKSGDDPAPPTGAPGETFVRDLLGRLGLAASRDDGSVRNRAVRGSAIALASFGISQVLTLVSNVVLTHLLPPAVFGLMALVRVVMQGLKMFSDVGIGPSLIHHPRGEEPAFVNTAWTIQVIRGLALWAAASALAWPFSRVYSAPELLWLLPVAALTSAIGGFNSPVGFTLQRRMNFAWHTGLNLSSHTVGIVVNVVLAAVTGSVWSLVIGGLVAAIWTMVLSHTTVEQPRARFAWDPDAVRDLVRFGRWIFVSTALTFFSGQADRLILGDLLTLDRLGVYALALSFAAFPGMIVQSMAGAVMLPALSIQARRDRASLAPAVLRARSVILPGGLCACVAIAGSAPILFEYLYDDRYREAGWICQALTASAWFRLLEISADRAVLAVGDAKPLALSNLVELGVTVAASVAGYVAFGLGGFIAGMTLGSLAAHLVVVAALRRHGIDILAQDLRFTVLAVVGGTFCALVPRADLFADRGTRLAAIVGATALCALPMTVWAVRRLLREVRGK